jgi:VWFA-related protein
MSLMKRSNKRKILYQIPLFAIMPAVAYLFMTLTSPIFGDDQSQETSEEPVTTKVYKVVVDLVSVTVSVTDKSGHSINDLTQNDFQVFEEGEPQQISVFTVEAAPGVSISAPKAAKGATVTPPTVMPLSRKIILFVDDHHIQFENLARMVKAGETFIRNSLGPNDLIALITSSGLRYTEFTRDRDSVIATLKKIFPIAQNAYRDVSNCPPLTDYQAYFIATNQQSALRMGVIEIAIPGTLQCAPDLQRQPDPVNMARSLIVSASSRRTDHIIKDTRDTLATISDLVKQLRNIEGRKTVVFLSDGLLATQDIPFQLPDAITAAARANIAFYSINTRGLVLNNALGDISNPVSIADGDEARIHNILESEERFRSEDPLNALASGTGGVFLHDSNDILGQLQTVANSTQVSYVLGFYSTNTKRDGKYRRISVKVKRPRTVVSAQQGYVAPRWEETFRRGKNEDIQGALQAPGNLKEIPFTLSLNVVRSDSTQSMVEIQTRIDVSKIRFEKKENQSRNVFNIVTVIYDDNKRFIDGRETQINFNLTDPNFGNALQEGLKHQTSFHLAPGKYTVKIIVREAGETKLGSATQKLEVKK